MGRGELDAAITAGESYDSNLYGSHFAVDDFFTTVTPSLSYNRDAGRIKAKASASVAIQRYQEQTQLNEDDLNIRGELRLDQAEDANFYGFLSAAYVEGADVVPELNTRIRYHSTSANAQGNWAVDPRTDVNFTSGYDYVQRNVGSDQRMFNADLLYRYKEFLSDYSLRVSGEYDSTSTSGYNYLGVPLDQDSYQLQLGLERVFRDSLHVWAGYGYRVLYRGAAETAGGQTRLTAPVFTISMDGPFLPRKLFPKVKSTFLLEYSNATAPGINDPGTRELSARLNLDWQARENTSVGFALVREQRLSANDLTVESTSVLLTFSQKLRYNLTGHLSGGYDWQKYRGVNRDDGVASASAGLDYTFAHNWNASLAYRYTSVSSNQVLSEFTRHLATVSVGYLF